MSKIARTVQITVSDEEWTQLREMVDTLGMRTTDKAATWIIRQALRGGLTILPLEPEHAVGESADRSGPTP